MWTNLRVATLALAAGCAGAAFGPMMPTYSRPTQAQGAMGIEMAINSAAMTLNAASDANADRIRKEIAMLRSCIARPRAECAETWP